MSDMDPLYELMQASAQDMSEAAAEQRQMMTADENTDVTVGGYGPKPSFSKQLNSMVDKYVVRGFPSYADLAAYTPSQTGVMAVDASTGIFYYWTGSAWVKSNYQPTLTQVAPEQMAVIMTGKNKFNKATITSGYYLFEGTGVPTANEIYCYSAFIPVTPGRVYSSSRSTRVVTFYDSKYNYLSDIASVSAFTAPANAAFVRVSILLTNLDVYMLSFGVGSGGYEAYQLVFRPVVNNALLNVYTSLGFKPGKNLFDPTDVIDGAHLSTLGTIFTDSDTTFTVSGYIPIDATKSYAVNQQYKTAAYYDANGAFISRQYDESYTSKAIAPLVIPANAAYLRIEVPTTVASLTQVEQNNLATSFESFRLMPPASYNGKPLSFTGLTAALTKEAVFKAGVNLYNKNDTTYGYINEFGSVIPAAASSGAEYRYSGYIPVTPGATYKSSLSMRFVAFYNASKQFISTVTSVTSVTAPAGAAYMRVTTLVSNVDTMMVVSDPYLPPFSAYVNVLRSVLDDGTPVSVPGAIIDTSSLTLDFVQQGLFQVGKNLYNYRTSQAGYINESGVINPGGTTYYYSDFIKVTPGQTYSLNVGARFIAYYTANKGFIKSDASAGQAQVSFTADENTHYVRITVGAARRTSLQVEAGTTSTVFEDFAYHYQSALADGTPVQGAASSASDVIPDDFGLERLRETHMRLNKMTYGDAIRLVVANIGDSYTRLSARYTLKLAQKLWHLFNGSSITTVVPPIGYGWRSFGFDSQQNSDIVGTNLTITGFTCAYNSGHGPDISSVTASAAGATISYNHNFALGFDQFLFAEGGSGVIQYQATGMASPITIDLSTYPAGMQIIPLSLPTTGSGTVTFTVLTAPAMLYGVNLVNPTASGILVHKMGGSGSRTTHWVNAMDTRWVTAVTNLAPDLVTIMLGTNDQGSNLTGAQFKANLISMIDTVRTARPTADILLVIPAENSRANTTPMTVYAKAMYEVARDDRDVAFLNLQKSFGEKPADYAYGSARPWMVADGIHPDPVTGGYAIAAAMVRALRVPAV
ncbi:tail fiber protein [Klebsiella phage S9a]|nr:tail fiber protein [Klebsiella phage S9a]